MIITSKTFFGACSSLLTHGPGNPHSRYIDPKTIRVNSTMILRILGSM